MFSHWFTAALPPSLPHYRCHTAEDRAIVLQLHKRDGSVDLISIPRDFAGFRSTHIVVKNRDYFKVIDV